MTTTPFSHIFSAVFSDATILTWMLILPVLGGLCILALPPAYAKNARPIAMAFCVATFLLSLLASSWFDWSLLSYDQGPDNPAQLLFRSKWITSLGAEYLVGVDGLSLPLVLLTTTFVTLACWASYGINKSVKIYFALLLFLLAGMIGIFVSLDLLLFFIFFEISLVPLYFLIGIWGGPKKESAAIKFLLYAILGSVSILVAILGIYYYTRADVAGSPAVFDLISLASNPLLKAKFALGGPAFHFGAVAFWLLFLGFAVRIPAVPLHTWFPDAHAEAPTPISMLLSAILVNTGAYGLLRIAYPLFPAQAANSWFYVALIATVTIAGSALVAMAQKDFKRLVAYASISQMGFVLLGLSVMTPIATTGALFLMIAQAVSSGMMCLIVGIIYDRAHHREIPRLGGLWNQMPAFTGWATLGFLAAMGLPGLCNFVGQLLVLLGAFSAADPASLLMTHSGPDAYVSLIWFGSIAAAAIVLTAACLLWTFQRVFMGASRPEHSNFPRLTSSEKWILAALGIAAIVIGIRPMSILDHIRPAVEGVLKMMTS